MGKLPKRSPKLAKLPFWGDVFGFGQPNSRYWELENGHFCQKCPSLEDGKLIKDEIEVEGINLFLRVNKVTDIFNL